MHLSAVIYVETLRALHLGLLVGESRYVATYSLSRAPNFPSSRDSINCQAPSPEKSRERRGKGAARHWWRLILIGEAANSRGTSIPKRVPRRGGWLYALGEAALINPLVTEPY